MKRVSKLILAMLLVLCLSVLSGCTKTSLSAQGPGVMTFNDQKITYGEVYIYAETVIDEYKKTYGDEVFSMKVKDSDGEERPLSEIAKEDVIEDIIRVKVLCSKAADYEVEMTNEERQEALDQAGVFWSNLTDAEIEETKITEDLVQKVITENVIADRVYQEVTKNFSVEISDENARETTFYDIYFSCYSDNGDGSVTKFSDEETEQQFNLASEAYNKLIDGGSTFEQVTNEYGLSNSSIYTLTPDEIKEIYGADVAEMLYDLSDGTYSLVTETEYGYHIFYMQALTDREATDRRKAEIEEQEKEEFFEDKYESWLRKMGGFSYEKDVDFDVYDHIVFN